MANGQYDITATQELLMSIIECRQMYGLEIASSIEKATDGQKKIPVGSLYPILKRLEKKGLLQSEYGESAPERGGARRRYYSLTGLGRSVLEETRSIRDSVATWQPTFRGG
ncbi:PadR family transcriptional regulator [Leptothoe sp. EHU-05/26/07-4]